jgi:hypothetical protein
MQRLARPEDCSLRTTHYRVHPNQSIWWLSASEIFFSAFIREDIKDVPGGSGWVLSKTVSVMFHVTRRLHINGGVVCTHRVGLWASF